MKRKSYYYNTPMPWHIVILKRGEDNGRIAQSARTKKDAIALIEKMPALITGYSYIIKKA